MQSSALSFSCTIIIKLPERISCTHCLAIFAKSFLLNSLYPHHLPANVIFLLLITFRSPNLVTYLTSLWTLLEIISSWLVWFRNIVILLNL